MKTALPLLLALIVPHAPLSACCGEIFEGVLSPADDMASMSPETNFIREITRIGAPEFRFTGASEAQCLVNSLDACLKRKGVPDAAREKIVLEYAKRRLAIAAPRKKSARVMERSGRTPEVIHVDENDYPETRRTWTPEPVAGLPPAYELYERAGDLWRAGEAARRGSDRVAAKEAAAPAVALWMRLAALPKEERRDLEVATRFMLAKAASVDPRSEETPAAIEAVRQAVRDGFPDPAGYAAASYQLEVHTTPDRPEKAEALIRVVAAVGPAWQIRELRRTLADIVEGAGFSGYEGEALRGHPKVREAIAAMLTSGFRGDAYSDGNDDNARLDAKAGQWLKFVERTQRDFPEAGLLAAAAYRRGDYEAAQRWADRAPGDDAAAAIIGAKLLLRAGFSDRAAGRLALAVPKTGRLYTADSPMKGYGLEESLPVTFALPYQEGEGILGRLDCPPTPAAFTYRRQWEGNVSRLYATRDPLALKAMAAAQLAALRLKRGEPGEALDLFMRCGLWRDAARVAERHIETKALAAHVPALPAVDSRASAEAGESPDSGHVVSPEEYLRYVIARRLIRENRFEAAMPLLPADVAAKFAEYRRTLGVAYDATRPDRERAEAFVAAADRLRREGELFYFSVTGPRRRDHKLVDPETSDPNETSAYPTIARLPTLRDRAMRYRAGELAVYADALLPRNDPLAAKALYEAGLAHAVLDPETADTFRKRILLRHPGTPEAKLFKDGGWYRKASPAEEKERK